MKNKDSINFKILISVFILYLLILAFALFFKFSIFPLLNSTKARIASGIREAILDPSYFLLLSDEEILSTILSYFFNVFVVIPLTLTFALIFHKLNTKFYLVYAFLFSLCVFILLEVLQYATFFGVFEINDLLFYSLGSLVALLIYYSLKDKYTNEKLNRFLKIILIIEGIFSLVIIVLIPFDIYYIFK